MYLFYKEDISEGFDALNEEESRHCLRVLRKTIGDTIHIGDGKGHLYSVQISEIRSKLCYFKILSKTFSPADTFRIHIAIAPTKNIDRTEWFVEKAVEIGIHEISFILCQNSERRQIKLGRIQKKAISACKQSVKVYLPRINALEPYDKFIKSANEQEKYIAHLDLEKKAFLSDRITGGKSCLVMIGPEGDFTEKEITSATIAGFQVVNLGKSRLRTETAGIVACQSLNQANF